MSSAAIEAYLAKLYTDSAAREAFLVNPESAARDAGLSAADAESLRTIDKAGLRMAAASYAHKRAQHRRPKKKLHEYFWSWWKRRSAR
ncbi:MAG: hypothetical protein IPP88_17615 [Betaproteobacteria bacterium]|nr:hypothetical protein [Betaproteobacteria bacterium]